jgi:hypothetical protein
LELDWSQLNVDAYTLMTTSPASKARLAPRAGTAAEMTWSSNDKLNGSAAVSVKQPISPFWDTRIGADMTVVRQPSTMSELLADKVANGGSEPQSSGSAWATIAAPGVASIWDKTAVEARVDPSQDQAKLGTALSKSLSLSQQYSLTLQNAYRVIEQGNVPAAGHSTRNYETEQSARLSIVDTGTSFRPARPSPPPTKNGFARSAPSRNYSAASIYPARSARRRSAPRAGVSPLDSRKAGDQSGCRGHRQNP